MSDQDKSNPNSCEDTLAGVMIHVHNARQFNARGAQDQVERCLESARQKVASYLEAEKVRKNG